MQPWTWTLFAAYLVVTAFLAWRGGQRTQSAAGFAIGSGRMNPWMAGMTLGACLASSSLFIIMPGFVYADGLPGLLGQTVPLVAGTAVGLWLFAPRFQKSGSAVHALTLPHWVGLRYESPNLRRLFAGLGVLQITYLVLIVVGCANLMKFALGVPYVLSVVLIVAFVFSYTGVGGAWAHALTNSMQGTIMLAVAVIIFASGYRFWADGSLVADLGATGLVAPDSRLFSSHLEIWLVPFLMGLALTTQPHLLTKALYVDGRRNLGITIGTAVGAFAVYALALFSGAYARLALPGGVRHDEVAARYLAEAFPWEPVGSFVIVAILAAAMSTIDGLLVALSASVSGDLLEREDVRTRRLVIAGAGVATILIALDPPPLVLILSQLGVFGLVVAAAGPLVAGLFLPGRLPVGVAMVSALVALAVHATLSLGGITENPGVGASIALPVGIGLAVGLSSWSSGSARSR